MYMAAGWHKTGLWHVRTILTFQTLRELCGDRVIYVHLGEGGLHLHLHLHLHNCIYKFKIRQMTEGYKTSHNNIIIHTENIII
jgi:hypothetical protein